jgi:polar amino acid transport system substrate-binding protein
VRLEQYSPESHKNLKNRWFGIDMEFTQALLSEANCEFEVIEVAWARALAMLGSGEIDMVLNMSKTKNRETLFYFIGPIRSETIVFAMQKNAQYILNKTDDIITLDKPVAVQRNAYYGDEVQKLLQHEEFQDMFITVTENDTKLALLKHGRVSGFLEARRNIIHGVKNDINFEGIWFHPFVIHQDPIYFALSKKSVSPKLKQRLADAFARLIAQGKIKKIVSKY